MIAPTKMTQPVIRLRRHDRGALVVGQQKYSHIVCT